MQYGDLGTSEGREGNTSGATHTQCRECGRSGVRNSSQYEKREHKKPLHCTLVIPASLGLAPFLMILIHLSKGRNNSCKRYRRKVKKQCKHATHSHTKRMHHMLSGLARLREAGEHPPQTVWRRRCQYVRRVLERPRETEHTDRVRDTEAAPLDEPHTTHTTMWAVWLLTHALTSAAHASTAERKRLDYEHGGDGSECLAAELRERAAG